MSNFRSTGHLPLKTSMTNKWKAQAPTSDLLEKQTRALEESLNKLKIAMHPDKAKSTTETNGAIWDKGKAGPLSQYANHILRDEPRRVFDANKPTKIRVLGDEPPATVVRPSLVANLFSAKPTTTTTKILKCGQCEKDEAKMKCLECAECYCASCFAHFHLRGALQRHRCVSLNESRPATPQKKKPPVGADVIFKELRFAQSKDDLLRKSTTTTNDLYGYPDEEEDDIYSEDGHGGDLLHGNYNEKNSAASFQQAPLQWRHGGEKKPKARQTKSTHETGMDTVHDSNGKLNSILMPTIEFHSSKLTYAEKLLVKKYRRANRNHEDFFQQRVTNPASTPREPLRKVENLRLDRSFPASNNSAVQIEPLYDNLPTRHEEESARTITAEDNHDDEDEELMRLKHQERSKSRTSTKPISRPNSSAMRKNSNPSRPNSVALFQHPLPSLLSSHPSDELKAAGDPQSRPSSAALKKPTKLDYRIPTMWNRNWKPEQSVTTDLDGKAIQVDQHSIAQFDLALNDLLDETKIELASQADKPSEPVRPPLTTRSERETPTPTPRQNSPFTFMNSSRKIDSSSSVDTGEGGFFTDVTRKKVVASPVAVPPPVIERSASNEWKSLLTNRSSMEQRPVIPSLISLRRTSIESFTRPPPKRSTHLEETHDDQSRPGSSLSSASLPVSITSSKPDYITRPSIERHPKILSQPPPPPPTTKKFRVEFPKKSSPPTIAPMVIEGKKVKSARNSARDSDEHLQQSINSTRSKISSGVQKSQTLLKTSSTSSMTSITRDENALKDESLTLTDLPVNKSLNRRSIHTDREPTKSRKIEFSVQDGMKWQQASTDSKRMSSSEVRRSTKVTTPRPSTPSNPTNSKVAQQFKRYDNDDGRSSRACQDVNDEQCFNQLREELCSELGMTSPGWDASLGDHVLKNLRGAEIRLTEKDLQDNLTMLEMKLRETELLQRSQTDDDLSVHDEIRKLLITSRHLHQRTYFTSIAKPFFHMEVIQEKAKLADERIQQLKSLITTIGTKQLDPKVYINILQEENTRLKSRVQNLVDELVGLQNQRGVTQEYDFVKKVPKAPTQSSVQTGVVAAAAPTTTEATASGEQQESKDKKDKKKKAPAREEKPVAKTDIDISRFDLRVGKIVSVEKHPDADSLYVEQIDVGEDKPRTVCSGLVKHMQTTDLDQKLVIVLCNLKPAKMRGVMSEAMVMCASTPDKVELLQPSADCKPGDRVECAGYNCSSPDAQIKKELSDQILPGMSTNDKGQATFKGTVWQVANNKGFIQSKTLVNVPIK